MPNVKPKKRQHHFSMMFSTAERLALESIAAERGLSASDVVRQWIREAAKQLGRDPQ